MEIVVRLANSPPVTFEVDEKGHGRAFFVLGIRKSGSTLLNKVCRALANLNSVKFVDIAGTFFRNNVSVGSWVNDPAVANLLRPGNVYGGFRNMPLCFQETRPFANARKVLLVRDPRDALISEYFSNAFSHRIPGTETDNTGVRGSLLAERKKALDSTIDDYVKPRARMMARTFLEYQSVSNEPNTLMLKYEDVVFDKRKMIDDILSHFKWSCPEGALGKLLERVDVRPEVEDPTAFIRKVTPGDHKEKLKAETIKFLNDEMHDALEFFGYQP